MHEFTMSLPERAELTDELHARSILPLHGEYYIRHIAYLGERELSCTYVERLHHAFGEDPPSALSKYEVFEFGGLMYKWEQHTEFFSVTLFIPSDGRNFTSLTRSSVELALTQLAHTLELYTLIDMKLLIQRTDETPEERLDEARSVFNDVSLCGVRISGGAGAYFTDYRLHEDEQVTRHLLFDHGMTPHQLGRQVVRIIEVENYRVLSMLGYHYVQTMQGALAILESRMQRLIQMIASAQSREDRELLDEVISLSMSAEQLIAQSSFRLNATRAYTQILFERIGSLRCVKIGTLRDLHGFMERRLTPSTRTVESFRERLLSLSRRLDRSSNLIRTRVDVKLEEQNSTLLRSMDRRARLQLRLQTTVEGLSVIALSYYALGLLGYLITPPAKYFGLSPKLIAGGLTLPVLAGVYWMTQRVHARSHLKPKTPPSDGG